MDIYFLSTISNNETAVELWYLLLPVIILKLQTLFKMEYQNKVNKHK